MWFALGFISVIGVAIGMAYWRMANRWRGHTANFSDQVYSFSLSKNKGRIHSAKLGIDCSTGLHFCLKPENLIDRFFKFIGLSEEQQLNRLHFDERVYVISDDKRLTPLLKYKTELHKNLESFFDKDRWPLFRVKKLWCRDNRLWLELTPRGKVDDDDIHLFAAQVLPEMNALANALSDNAPEHSGNKDYFIVKAAIFLGLSSALAINGFAQIIRITIPHFPVVLDNNGLLHSAVLWGSVITGIMLFACVMMLGRTSRAHLVFIEILFVGAFGAISTTYAELRDFNIEFDTQAATLVESHINEHYTRKCGKNNRSTCYHLSIAAKDALTENLSMQVDAHLYYRLQQGALVWIRVHPGQLGYRWLESPRATP